MTKGAGKFWRFAVPSGVVGLLLGLTIAFQNCSRVSYESRGTAQGTSVQNSDQPVSVVNAAPPVPVSGHNGHPYDGKPKSCREILQAGMAKGNGLYTIWPDGVTQVQCYCDFIGDGGAWTLVINQPRARMFGMPIVSAVDVNTHGKLDYPQIFALLAASTTRTENNIRVLVELSQESYTNGMTPIPATPVTFRVFLNSNGNAGSGAYWPSGAYPGDCSGDPGLQRASFQPVSNYWFFGSGYGTGVSYSEGRNPVSSGNPFYRVPWTDLDGFHIDASNGGAAPCQGRIASWTRSIGLKGSVWIR